MTKSRIGLIRVLTTDDPEILGLHGKAIMEAFPDLEVITRCIPDQPQGVFDDETEQQAWPKVVALAQEMVQEDDLKAMVISCAADPGVCQTREVLTIPVIGAGSAAAHAALALGTSIAALGITADVPLAMASVLGSALVAAGKPAGVQTTLDLMKPSGQRAVLEAAAELMAKGAKVLALACTGMTTIGAAQVIRQKLGIKVVDPVIASGLFAWYATKEF